MQILSAKGNCNYKPNTYGYKPKVKAKPNNFAEILKAKQDKLKQEEKNNEV